MRLPAILTLSLSLSLAACGSSGGSGNPSGPVGKRLGPAVAAALDHAARTPAPLWCGAPDLPAAADQTVAEHWTITGHTLTVAAGTPVKTIGVIADAGGAAPATLAALGRLRTKLATADLVLALGGMGADQAQLEATIGAVASPTGKVPIVVVPGDLEPIDAMENAIAALVARKVPAVDGRRVQRIALPDTTIALVGGTLAPERLVAAGGCVARATDRAAVAQTLAAAATLRILAGWEAPRTIATSRDVADLAAWGGIAPPTPRTTGDLPPEAIAGADVVLAGAIDNASAMRSGARAGSAIALSPGSADATRGGHPSAGLLVLGADHAWTWHPVTDAPPTSP